MSDFDAEKYWLNTLYKKWVVVLVKRKGKQSEFDTKIVSASKRESAILTARANTLMQGKIALSSCRLATPNDLGCVPSDTCHWCYGKGKFISGTKSPDIICNKCNGLGKNTAA